MANVPVDIATIPLTTAGSQIIPFDGDFFNFIYASNADGTRNQTALIEAAFGKNSIAYAPMEQNNTFEGKYDQIKLRWAAQPGVTAKLFMSSKVSEPGGISLMKLYSPPARQLVSSALAGLFGTAAITITTTATLIDAADTTRQSMVVQNLSGIDVYLGGSDVTTANGIRLASGESFAIDKSTAAVYGRVGAGTADVRVLRERS